MCSGGNDLGGEQIRRPEHKAISAASKSRSAKSRVRGLEAGSRPTLLLGKADDTKEETGKRTSWDSRGIGSGSGGSAGGQEGIGCTRRGVVHRCRVQGIRAIDLF